MLIHSPASFPAPPFVHIFAAKSKDMDFSFSSIEPIPNAKAAVAFVPDSGTVFREDTRLDYRVLSGGQRFVPWGVDNAMPYNIISKVEDDETLATCMQFNAEVCYGSGLRNDTCIATAKVKNDVVGINGTAYAYTDKTVVYFVDDDRKDMTVGDVTDIRDDNDGTKDPYNHSIIVTDDDGVLVSVVLVKN